MSQPWISRTLDNLSKLMPSQAEDSVRLQLEQLKATEKDFRPYIIMIFGTLAALVSLTWIPWPLAAIWGLLVVTIPIVLLYLRDKFIARAQETGNVKQATLHILTAEFPLHFIWLAYVPLCWVEGDAVNNAYLVIFLLTSATVLVRLYGPCFQLALPAIAVYMPFAAWYTLKTDSFADWLLPPLQMLYLCLAGFLSFHHQWVFRESTIRMFTIEALVDSLVLARDDAERANKAKSAFLASMSHELRTPLNAIIGFSDMMRQEIYGPVSPPRYREYIEDILSSGQHLLALINDVLDLSKVEAGKRELTDNDIDLEELVRGVVQFVTPQAQTRGVEIDVSLEPECILRADERAVRQILLNFLTNAVKFSQSGGKIEIYARISEAKNLLLGVTDHGIGMDAEGIRKALEPYGQVQLTATKESQGTGLGLPIAKALTEALGAVFHIDSVIGVGTRVWCDFPSERVRIRTKVR